MSSEILKTSSFTENVFLFFGWQKLPSSHVLESIGESLFTFFASLAYVPLFLLELQNRLF